MRAIQQTAFGGPEVLELVELPAPVPGPDEVLIEVAHAGMNFADTHQRENSYVTEQDLPRVPGSEVAGVRADTGERVVALTAGGTGGYAGLAVANKQQIFPIPEGCDDGTALALLIQGLTAWHLYVTCARVQPGETVVVVSGAGGVGSLAVQLGKQFGAAVIATASSDDKRALCLELGAAAAIDGSADGLTERLTEAAGGLVDAVFEIAGGPVFDACLDALGTGGRIVPYGISSKEQNEVRTGRLLKRSQSVIGFWLFHYLRERRHCEEPLSKLFALAAAGELTARIGATYSLSDAARAQAEMVARKTSGKLLLDVSA